MFLKGLYLVTPDYYGNGFFEVIRSAISGGVDIVQYRDKTNSAAVREDVANRMRDITKEAGIPYFVDDDPVLAKNAGADGVHVGKDDPAIRSVRKIFSGMIGVSTYGNPALAETAQKEGASYVAFGSFFRTESKKDAGIYDMAILNGIKEKIRIPVFVIGGINEGNIHLFDPYDIDGFAVISAIFSAKDPEKAARDLKHEIEERPRH